MISVAVLIVLCIMIHGGSEVDIWIGDKLVDATTVNTAHIAAITGIVAVSSGSVGGIMFGLGSRCKPMGVAFAVFLVVAALGIFFGTFGGWMFDNFQVTEITGDQVDNWTIWEKILDPEFFGDDAHYIASGYEYVPVFEGDVDIKIDGEGGLIEDLKTEETFDHHFRTEQGDVAELDPKHFSMKMEVVGDENVFHEQALEALDPENLPDNMGWPDTSGEGFPEGFPESAKELNLGEFAISEDATLTHAQFTPIEFTYDEGTATGWLVQEINADGTIAGNGTTEGYVGIIKPPDPSVVSSGSTRRLAPIEIATYNPSAVSYGIALLGFLMLIWLLYAMHKRYKRYVRPKLHHLQQVVVHMPSGLVQLLYKKHHE